MPKPTATATMQKQGKEEDHVKSCRNEVEEDPATVWLINRLTPNDLYMGRTAPLTSKRCIIYIYIYIQQI